MPYSLKGRNVLVTGGSRGLGAVICKKFAQEGANVAINYVSNAEAAQQVADSLEEKFSCKTFIIKGDAETREDNVRLVQETVKNFGGLDIIVANAGWTKMSQFSDLHALTDDEWNKCWGVNVMSHLQLFQEVAPIFNANPEGGVYLITSSVAGVANSGSSMAYSVTKAAGLQLMKNLAYTQGPKIRINAILPGLLLTEWGQRFGADTIEAIKGASTLRHETDLDDCADAFISAAKNTSMTGQQIIIDAGLVMSHPGARLTHPKE
ncbi:NADP(+)-dependent dehydrogenase [Trichoderma ceciliae]